MNPYTGCDLAAEYAIRAAFLCRTTLIQTALVWLSGYVCFEKLLLVLLFGSRGLALGIALRLISTVHAPGQTWILAGLFGLVCIILIMQTYFMRVKNCVRPLSETFTHLLISSGFSCAVIILSSFLL